MLKLRWNLSSEDLLKEPSPRRLRFLILTFIIAILLVLYRYYSLGVLKSNEFLLRKLSLVRTRVKLPPPRGDIVDRRGRVLAYDRPVLSCYLQRYKFSRLPKEKRERILKILSDILNLNLDELRSKLNSARYDLLLKRELPPEVASWILELGLAKYGILVKPVYLRSYTHTSTAHVIGYVGFPSEEDLRRGILPTEYVGRRGLESVYNDVLRGEPGEEIFLQDVTGKPIRLEDVSPPRKGETLVTTLDLELQEYAYQLMDYKWDELVKKGIRRWGGAVVMMETDGSLLVALSYPTFDPNAFVKGLSSKEYAELSAPPYPLLNRFTTGLYPPASTFKIVTALAALQEGIITPYTIINCTGMYYIGNYGFPCFNRSGHGPLNLRKALAYSCDYYFYKVGYQLGWKRLVKWASKLGVGRKTGIEIYEEPGLLPTPKWKQENYNEPWLPGDTVNMSIGQGMLLVTPLQVARYTAGIATGYIPRPRLAFRREVRLTPVGANPDNLKAIREGMLGAVEEGTAKVVKKILRARGIDVKVAGKTGTCENFPSAYNPKGLNHTWFTAFAPYEDPKVIVTVFLEQSGGYGGEHAAWIAGHLLAEYFSKYR